MKFLEVKTTVPELKNTPDGNNCALDVTKENINELEDVAIQTDQN